MDSDNYDRVSSFDSDEQWEGIGKRCNLEPE